MGAALLLTQSEDQRRVERALPGYMFALLFQSLAKQGMYVRQDLHDLADKASAAALEGTLGAHQAGLAGIIEKEGYAVLKNAGQESVPVLIGALARCLVKIKDQGIPVDENGLLVALGIAAEIDEGVTDWGRPGEINTTMAKIDNNLRQAGFFFGVVAGRA